MKNEKLLIVNIAFLSVMSFFLSCKDSKKKEVVESKIEMKATGFLLSDTKLSDNNAFKHAMNKNAEWLLELQPDRFLHRFHLNAGLQPKAEIYSGWESMGVSGHTLGHYLSACAMMYATTGDIRFKEKVDYIISEMACCQDARGTGYVGGIPDEDRIWSEVSKGDIRSAGFDLNGCWVPWYTQHKVLEGLINAYLYTDNEQAKEVAVKFSDWAVKMFAHLNEEQFQTMLACEFGGMNEAFAEMYAITGEEAYLNLAEKFYHKAILDPLKEQRDELEGKHSNTQVPKIIGAARLYELTGKEEYRVISTYYWDRIVNHHTYLNGGNSDYEHLGKPDCLNDRLSSSTSETCNTYNMLKLTRHLFEWEPKPEYFDYYERALYNHILASQNPDDGMVFYFAPLASGSQKAFSSRDDSFWCCVGTGIENHVKYSENVFFKSGDGGLFVNLFIPTTLQWKEKGLTVKLETQFPEDDKVVLKFEGKKQRFPLKVRYPKWARNGIKLTLNGNDIPIGNNKPGSYISIDEEWGSGAELVITLPMELSYESMPDNPNRIGLFYGPILLSAALGEGKIEPYDIPVFISDNKDFMNQIKTEDKSKMIFSTQLATIPSDVKLMPFYKIYGQKHAVYFDMFDKSEWDAKNKEYQKIQEEKKKMEARTIDIVRIGEMQPERDHNLKSENSNAGEALGHKYRDAIDGWFSFDVKVIQNIPLQMICSYWGTDRERRNFDIYIDGKLFKEVSLKGEHGNQIFDEVYNIPPSFINGKERITVKFQSKAGNYAGGLFGFRMLKK